MNFVIHLSSPVRINGVTTRVVGPFATIRDATQWVVDNDEALARERVDHSMVETLQLGKVQS